MIFPFRETLPCVQGSLTLKQGSDEFLCMEFPKVIHFLTDTAWPWYPLLGAAAVFGFGMIDSLAGGARQ